MYKLAASRGQITFQHLSRSRVQEASRPYETLTELPKGVRDNLPKHAQEIYMEAYNNAWEQYHHQEERARRVAWGAVKKKYEKDEAAGEWKSKSN